MANSSSFGIWDDCDDRSLSDRVAIKQNAVDVAHRIVAAMKFKLRSSIDRAKADNVDLSEHLKELQEIVASEETIRQEYCKHQVLVGVAGVSGAGKTSAINAWLDIQDLLPSSCEQAATAVVCLVSWNYDKRPQYEFKAEVDFHSTAVIRQEVDEFFAASQEYHGNEDPDDVSDASAAESRREMEANFKGLLQKIRAVWGHKEDELKKMTAEALWESRPDVVRLLGTTKYLHSSDPETLSQNVSPFLDSKKSKHGGGQAFAAWPLVKCVRIFARSDILKHGLTLVDLPGLGDANSSRTQIARDFFPRLSITAIVSPIERAADEKTAHDLLDEHHEIRLEMDGKYNAQGFGFILSKSDIIEPKSFLTHATQRTGLRPAQDKRNVLQELTEKIKALDSDLKISRKNLASTKRQAKKLDNQIKKARTCLRKTGTTTEDKEKLGREIEKWQSERRKFDLPLKDQEKRVQRGLQRQGKVQLLREDSCARLKNHCVNARNEFVVDLIQQDISQRMSQTESVPEAAGEDSHVGTEQINVIPTSSTAYWSLSDDLDIYRFTDEEMTGVPEVRRWLSSSALIKVEEPLDTLLNEYSCLLRRLHECSADDEDGRHMTIFTTEDLDTATMKAHEEFTQAWTSHIFESAVDLHAINPLVGHKGIIKKSLTKLPQIISDWSLKFPDDDTSSQRMVFGTYGAILTRQGDDFKGRSGITYSWLDKLTAPLLRALTLKWKYDIHRKVPDLSKRLLEYFGTCWESYIASIRCRLRDLSPALATQFEHQSHALVQIRNSIQDQIRLALDEVKTNAALAHPRLRTSLQESLAPIFEEACSIRGRGAHQARQDLVYEKAIMNGDAMLGCAFEEVKKRLDENKAAAQKRLDCTADMAIAKVKESLRQVIPNKHHSGETHVDPNLQRHLSACLTDIQHLSKQWQTEWARPLPDSTSDADDSKSIKVDDDAEMKDESEDSRSESEMESFSRMATEQNEGNARKRRYSETQIKMEVG